MYDFEFSGDEELTKKLEEAIKMYPDFAEKRLRAAGNKFKREVQKKCDEETKKRTGKLKKGMKLSKTKEYGSKMYVEFAGTAPHFHLVENGHEIINKKGENVGFVQGKHMVRRTAESFQPILDKEMEKVLKEVIKRSRL